MFSEYSPDTWSKREKENSIPFEYGRRKGYFRHFGFGLVSLYKSDLDAVGGINVTIKVDLPYFIGKIIHSVYIYRRIVNKAVEF